MMIIEVVTGLKANVIISDNFWKQWEEIVMLDDIWEQIKQKGEL